jgi:hypothetical protein
VVVQGQLNRTEGAIIEAALRVFDVPDSVDENGEFIGDPRSLGKRNADALVEVCKFALSHRDGAGESGRFVPHVSLIVDIAELRASALRGAGVRSRAGLERVAEARGWSAAERSWFADALHRHGDAVSADGSELDATAVATLTCDSVVQRVFMAGSKLLNLGREVRTATAAQRRGIVERRDVEQNPNIAMFITSITGSTAAEPISTEWCCYAAPIIGNFINPAIAWSFPIRPSSPCTRPRGGAGQACPSESRLRSFPLRPGLGPAAGEDIRYEASPEHTSPKPQLDLGAKPQRHSATIASTGTY